MYSRILDALSGQVLAIGVRRDADGAFVPADPANGDWLAYQAWLKAGNTPADPDQPPKPAGGAASASDAGGS